MRRLIVTIFTALFLLIVTVFIALFLGARFGAGSGDSVSTVPTGESSDSVESLKATLAEAETIELKKAVVNGDCRGGTRVQAGEESASAGFGLS